MRVIFCGTPDFAVPSLRRLASTKEFEVAAVVTQPDKPRDRGQRGAAAPPVKEIAQAAGVSVFQPANLKSQETMEFFERLAPDAVAIVAYGRIIPPELLRMPRLGWINLHASLLPKYRGAAPIQRAILCGETQTGVTTMRIDEGLDTGQILEQITVEIGADETALELSQRMAKAGAELLAGTLRKLAANAIAGRDQDGTKATYAPPLVKGERWIPWDCGAREIYNRMRAFEPWPGACSNFRGKACQIWGRPLPKEAGKEHGADDVALGTIVNENGGWAVACGGGSRLKLERLQLEGRKRLSIEEFARGARFQPGERFEPAT